MEHTAHGKRKVPGQWEEELETNEVVMSKLSKSTSRLSTTYQTEYLYGHHSSVPRPGSARSGPIQALPSGVCSHPRSILAPPRPLPPQGLLPSPARLFSCFLGTGAHARPTPSITLDLFSANKEAIKYIKRAVTSVQWPLWSEAVQMEEIFPPQNAKTVSYVRKDCMHTACTT